MPLAALLAYDMHDEPIHGNPVEDQLHPRVRCRVPHLCATSIQMYLMKKLVDLHLIMFYVPENISTYSEFLVM